MNKAVAGVGLLLGLCVAPVWARSQLEPPELSRYLRWGVLRVRPGFELSRLGYDDNIFRGESGTEVSDTTATLSPRLEGLLLLGGRAFLTFNDRLEYTAYLRNRDQNFVNNRASARLTVPLSGIGLFADVALNRLKLRPVDLDDIRPVTRERRLAVGWLFEPGWRTEIQIRRTFADFANDDPDFSSGEQTISERLDRSERGTALDVGYRILGRTKAVLAGSVKSIEFDHPYRDKDRDTREWRLMGGLAFGEGGPLTGTFQVGWGKIDAADPSLTDFSDLIGEATLVHRLSSQTRVRLEAQRIPGFTVLQANSYYLNTTAELRVVHYLNRAFGVESGLSAGRLTFPGYSERVDRIDRRDVGVRLRLAENALDRRVEYSFRIGRYRRNSSVDDLDREQTTFGFGAVVGF